MDDKVEYVELLEGQRAIKALNQLASAPVSDFAHRMGTRLIMDEARTGEPCLKTTGTLAAEFGKSVSSVQRARRELVKHKITEERLRGVDSTNNGTGSHNAVAIHVRWEEFQ